MNDLGAEQELTSEFMKFLNLQLKESRDEVQRLKQVRFHLRDIIVLYRMLPP